MIEQRREGGREGIVSSFVRERFGHQAASVVDRSLVRYSRLPMIKRHSGDSTADGGGGVVTVTGVLEVEGSSNNLSKPQRPIGLLDLPDVRTEVFQQPHKASIRMSSHTQRYLLMFEGVALLSIVAALNRVLSVEGRSDALSVFKLFYFPLLPIVAMMWLWGLNVYVWSQLPVNYVRVFEAEDRPTLPSHDDLFRMAHAVTCAVLVSAVIFISCSLWDMRAAAHTQAELLYLGLLAFVLLPGDYFFKKQRRFLVATVARIVFPIKPVSFAEFLLADVLTSVAKPISDVGLVVCHMIHAWGGTQTELEPEMHCSPTSWVFAWVLALPYLWRLVQCVRIYYVLGEKPQLVNALKYFTAFPVIYLSTAKYHIERDTWLAFYKPLWIVSAIINSFFSYYWDISRDWDLGLFSLAPGGHSNLRHDLVYTNKEFYQWAIVSNLFLRITWTFKLSAQLRGMIGLSLFISFLEVFRRFQWLFIRIEVALLKDIRAYVRDLET